MKCFSAQQDVELSSVMIKQPVSSFEVIHCSTDDVSLVY